ncbi:MAG: Gfo/Idh/MocA family oxidoreductase [Ruminococcaceae bacterium]|nr:Gfo/Idh/MocA family oxidoreductase [Oscillospiraceae bacterium]
MSKLRIGVIGTGNIGNVHLGAYQKVADAEVVAICDINEERLNKAGEKFGIEKRYTSVTEMIKNEKLDAVDVCVWNCNHASCAIEALNAGINVLCEKPMAYNTRQAIEMKEAAEKSGKLLMIAFVMRFTDGSRVVKDFIDNGYLGDVYYSKATYLRRHGSPGGWFSDKSRSGGGPIIDLGVHVIDYTRYAMGSPKPVSVSAVAFDKLGDRRHLKTNVGWIAADSTKDDIFDVEDAATAIIRYDNGAATLLETSYSLNVESVIKSELFGTKGGIKSQDNKLTMYTEINGFLADLTPHIGDLKDSKDAFVAEIEHFVDCIKNGTPCRATAEDGIIVMKILDAIYESAKTGKEVEIKY